MPSPPPTLRRLALVPSLVVALAPAGACGGAQLPDEEQTAIDTLEQLTGHRHLHPWRTPQVLAAGLRVDDLLGHVVVTEASGELGLGGRAWHGPVVGLEDTDRPISLELSGERFLELRTALERLFGLSFETGTKYRVRLDVAWHPIRLQEPQPTLEHLGDESIFGAPFVSSLAYASRMTIETFVEKTIEGGVELEPVDLAAIGARGGNTETRANRMEASNVLFGYRTTDGADWQRETVADRPQLALEILKPTAEQVIRSPRVSIQVRVRGYRDLGPERGDLQIYAWIQQIGANEGTVSPIGAPVDLETGTFELLTSLGGLDDGNGERYSIVVFALFTRLYNVDERTRVPTTSFTRPARDNGHASVVVTRRDVIN